MPPAATVERMFSQIAPRYDLVNRLLSLGLDVGWRRRAVRELGLEPGDPAIDLCCGTGDLAADLRPARVTGVDFSEAMLEQARRKYPDLTFVHGDALNVPLPDQQFQGATVAFGLRNVESLELLWREMRRLVRPGGRIVSLELTRPKGLLGLLHSLYLQLIVPLVGGLVSGDFQAYRYLSRTIARFIPPEEIAQTMVWSGLTDVRIIPLAGGIATLHVATRP